MPRISSENPVVATEETLEAIRETREAARAERDRSAKTDEIQELGDLIFGIPPKASKELEEHFRGLVVDRGLDEIEEDLKRLIRKMSIDRSIAELAEEIDENYQPLKTINWQGFGDRSPFVNKFLVVVHELMNISEEIKQDETLRLMAKIFDESSELSGKVAELDKLGTAKDTLIQEEGTFAKQHGVYRLTKNATDTDRMLTEAQKGLELFDNERGKKTADLLDTLAIHTGNITQLIEDVIDLIEEKIERKISILFSMLVDIYMNEVMNAGHDEVISASDQQ